MANKSRTKTTRPPLRKLRKLRLIHERTQADVATACGLSLQSYNSKENGHNEFTLREVESIMIYLNEPFENIFI